MAFLADPTNTATAAADPMVPHIARVRRRRRDAPRVWTLDIEVQEIEPAFAPGQFNMLTVFGVGEVPISLSGDPAAPDSPRPYDPRRRPRFGGAHAPCPRRYGRVTRAVRRGLADGGGRGSRRRGGGRRARPRAAAPGALPPARRTLPLRQDHPALRHAQPGRHLVPPRTRILAAATRHRHQGDGRSCGLGLAWPRRRRHHADPRAVFRPAPRHRAGLRAGSHDALCHRCPVRRRDRGRFDLPVDGAQHEMRDRILRPLPVRDGLCLPRRAGVPVRSGCKRCLD